MKTPYSVLLLFPWAVVSVQAQFQPSSGTPTAALASTSARQKPTFVATERGPYHTRWASVQCRTNGAGRILTRTNTVIELGAAINRLAGGQWVASTPAIEPAPGGALGSGAGHQVQLASDLNTQGSVQVTGPDGRTIRSHIIGLSYYDSASGSNVVIAVTKSCQGVILPSGKATLYADAFAGVKADITYRYRASGVDQDVTLRQQLPPPEEWGLSSQSSELQIITEYLDSPTSVRAGAAEDDIEFGAMHFAPGRAFAMQPSAPQTPLTLNVNRHWAQLAGRRFLIESVPASAVRAATANLAKPQASLRKAKLLPTRQYPTLPEAVEPSPPMLLAQAGPSSPGFVLDWGLTEIGAGCVDSYTFQSGNMYLISDAFAVTNATFEGSVILKFGTDGRLAVSNLVSTATQYQPVTLTWQEDASLGYDVSTGDTNRPANPYLTVLAPSGTATLANMHFRGGCCGVAIGGGLFGGFVNVALDLWDCQFVNCTGGVIGGSVGLHNVLFSGCGWPVQIPVLVSGSVVSAEHVTADAFDTFCTSFFCPLAHLQLTNSLFTGGGSLYTNVINLLGTNYPPPETNQVVWTNAAGTFLSFGAGNYYLPTNSSLLQAGTPGISALMAAELKQKTTVPPIALFDTTTGGEGGTQSVVNLRPQLIRDIGPPPTIGYHYPAVDYCAASFTITNATLAVHEGTVVAYTYALNSIALGESVDVQCIGSPAARNIFVCYAAVMEQPVNLPEGSNRTSCEIINPVRSPGQRRPATFRSTDFLLFPGDGFLLSPYAEGAYDQFGLRDCRLLNGAVYWYPMEPVTYDVEDNVFEYGCLDAEEWDQGWLSVVAHNNLFHNSSVTILSDTNCTLRDNAFDASSVSIVLGPSGNLDHNAYLNGSVLLSGNLQPDDIATNLAWAAGPLGGYYQPPDSPLIDAGSTNADALGLYAYTVLTNQTPEETSKVDIGAHYPAILPPTIALQPASQTVIEGASVSFSVVVTNTLVLNYQWAFNGTAIPGATGSSLAWTNAQMADAGSYAVVVANFAGSVSNSNAVLTVGDPPVITTQPASQAADEGASVAFTVTATGLAPLSYQWKFNGTDISGATTATYSITGVQTSDAGTYTVTVQNVLGTTNSAGALLTIIPAAWLTQHFGTNYLNNPQAAPSADPDHDGLTNLEEFQQGTDPGNPDTDGDGLSDGVEVHVCNSNPLNAHTFHPTENDAVFLVSGGSVVPNDTHPLHIDSLSYDFLLQQVTITFSGTPGLAPDGAACDLYGEDSLFGASKWRLYACGSPGQTVFRIPMASYMYYFRVASAFDYDGDGVTDGAEALVYRDSTQGKNSSPTSQSTDGTLPDAWKVQMGLLPWEKTAWPDGPSQSADLDSSSNLQEWQNGTDPYIANDTPATARPVVTVAVVDGTALWASPGKSAVFRFTRTGPTTGSLTANYCVGGTADCRTDYSLSPSPGPNNPPSYPFSITFAAGESSVDLTLAPNAGSGAETAVVALVPFWPTYTPANTPADWLYVVDPKHDRASATILDPPAGSAELAVAVHDSELTRKLGSLSSGGDSSGADIWKYPLIRESVEEALRSDGTPFVVVSDADIANGRLLKQDGTAKYPILISLAAEAIQVGGSLDEVGPLHNYIQAGGFVLVGSSSFTRNPDGSYRTEFALANEMGVQCVNEPGSGTPPGSGNWADNFFLNNFSYDPHRVISHLPAGRLTWRMPTSAEEIPWGVCDSDPYHNYAGSHKVWQVAVTTAKAIAEADGVPYLTVNHSGNGWVVYDAALQPLIAHSGPAPGMYPYMIVKKTVEWAFESSQRPVVRLSPWPYGYNAAFMVRHDLENLTAEIAHVSQSAFYESQRGANGDYYFCTGAIVNEPDFEAIKGGLKEAANNYGATIGPHNGGRPNPRSCVQQQDYNFYHWGPDEVLDLVPPGYTTGRGYALDSLSISFGQADDWLPAPNNPRLWVSPYFNATREASYAIQEQLNVKITGEQKLSPLPSWTLSTQTDCQRCSFLSEPVSDWFVHGEVAQVLGPWQDHDGVTTPNGFHTSQTMHNGVDFYYTAGALINFYSHSLSDSTGIADGGQATPLVQDYIQYVLGKPLIWSANARSIYQWWLKRSAVQAVANCSTSGNTYTTSINVAGAQDDNTAVEVLVPATGVVHSGTLQVTLDGVPAPATSVRQVGNDIKVKVGTHQNAVISYGLNPVAQDDGYFAATEGATRTVPAGQGVLQNDNSPRVATLTAVLDTTLAGLTWDANGDGGFTYHPPVGAAGRQTFTYHCYDGTGASLPATVSIMVAPSGAYLAEDFYDPLEFSVNWVPVSGGWAVNRGQLVGGPNNFPSGGYGTIYRAAGVNNWSGDCSVEARIKFQAGAYGGGICGRVNPSTGARYGLWLYPEDSTGGQKRLVLVKFWGWTTFGYGGAEGYTMHAQQLPQGVEVGTAWHTLRLSFAQGYIDAYYDPSPANPYPIFSVHDTDDQNDPSHPPLSNGGVGLDMWNSTADSAYTMSVDYVIASTYVSR